MGVVYRATDTALRRNVAVKVLPDHCANDPDMCVRLQREAHLLAALNHPRIAAIHGFETQDSLCFLVLEYVPGQTLADILSARRVPVADALRIGLQIAEALEAAHERGIIHRDLKPANVKITGEGTVKVLDFGLARTIEGGTTNAETATFPNGETQPGIVLGTAAYMSPEQARAMPVDRRTDVWAFGCVLFELLTRTRAFSGATGSDCIAAVLTRS
jgi:eukaryotic-like serine/threonine-protein kinase